MKLAMFYLYRLTHWRIVMRFDTYLATVRLHRRKYDPLSPLWGQL